jgi:hypothetical protein
MEVCHAPMSVRNQAAGPAIGYLNGGSAGGPGSATRTVLPLRSSGRHGRRRAKIAGRRSFGHGAPAAPQYDIAVYDRPSDALALCQTTASSRGPALRPAISAIVDCGQDGGHGNIDVNDPQRTYGPVLNTRVAKLWDLPMITLCSAIDPA